MAEAKALFNRHCKNWEEISKQFQKDFPVNNAEFYQAYATIYGACIIAEAIRTSIEEVS